MHKYRAHRPAISNCLLRLCAVLAACAYVIYRGVAHRDRVKTVQKCRLRCIWKSKRGFTFITPKQNATHTPPGADSPRENLDDLFTSDVDIV